MLLAFCFLIIFFKFRGVGVSQAKIKKRLSNLYDFLAFFAKAGFEFEEAPGKAPGFCKKPTAPCVPRRSPIQVLTGLNAA